MGFSMLAARSEVNIWLPYFADTPILWFHPFRELTNSLVLSARTDKQGITYQFWPAMLSDKQFEILYGARAVLYV